jgi:hypothetical protein
MPAIEQGLAAWTDVQGRRWIILRGGNRGVVAAAVESCRLSYGDLKSSFLDSSPSNDGDVSPVC